MHPAAAEAAPEKQPEAAVRKADRETVDALKKELAAVKSGMRKGRRTGIPVSAEITPIVIVMPAEGPSFGTAPSGKWM